MKNILSSLPKHNKRKKEKRKKRNPNIHTEVLSGISMFTPSSRSDFTSATFPFIAALWIGCIADIICWERRRKREKRRDEEENELH